MSNCIQKYKVKKELMLRSFIISETVVAAGMYVLNCNISTMDCHLLKSSYRDNKLNMNAFSLCLLYGRTK